MKELQPQCLWFWWSHIRTSEDLWSWWGGLSISRTCVLNLSPRLFFFFTASFRVWRRRTLVVGSDLLAIKLCANNGNLPGKELTSDPLIRGSGRSSALVYRHTRRHSDTKLNFTLPHFLTKQYYTQYPNTLAAGPLTRHSHNCKITFLLLSNE